MSEVRVLVVEDDPQYRDLLNAELSSQGYRVSAAPDGEEALRQAAEKPFDIVIGDVHLPGRSGIEVLEEIKKRSPATEVILITAHKDAEAALAAVRRGAYALLHKPFHSTELLALIQQALNKVELKATGALYEASLAILGSAKLETLLPLIARLSSELLGADDVSIMLRRGTMLELAATSSPELQAKVGAQIPLGERVAGRAASWKETLMLCGPIEQDPRFPGYEPQRPVRCAMVHPLLLDDEPLGVINVNRTLRCEPFTDLDRRHLVIFGSFVAQAVQNASARQRLEAKVAELELAQESLQAAQAKLVQNEKLAAVGRLGASVAHELNNPLTGILTFSELLLRERRLPAAAKEPLATIHEQAERCRAIVRRFLELGRQGGVAAEKREVSLRGAVESALRLCRHVLEAASAEVVLDWSDCPSVHADFQQLEQVFVNLITNAAHAMEGCAHRRLRVSARAGGGKARVAFEDTGCGIPREDLPRLFEPFFSTKPVGKGTGLGLSVCAAIVSEHGGHIEVESAPQKGITFTVELPAGTASAASLSCGNA